VHSDMKLDLYEKSILKTLNDLQSKQDGNGIVEEDDMKSTHSP